MAFEFISPEVDIYIGAAIVVSIFAAMVYLGVRLKIKKAESQEPKPSKETKRLSAAGKASLKELKKQRRIEKELASNEKIIKDYAGRVEENFKSLLNVELTGENKLEEVQSRNNELVKLIGAQLSNLFYSRNIDAAGMVYLKKLVEALLKNLEVFIAEEKGKNGMVKHTIENINYCVRHMEHMTQKVEEMLEFLGKTEKDFDSLKLYEARNIEQLSAANIQQVMQFEEQLKSSIIAIKAGTIKLRFMERVFKGKKAQVSDAFKKLKEFEKKVNEYLTSLRDEIRGSLSSSSQEERTPDESVREVSKSIRWVYAGLVKLIDLTISNNGLLNNFIGEMNSLDNLSLDILNHGYLIERQNMYLIRWSESLSRAVLESKAGEHISISLFSDESQIIRAELQKNEEYNIAVIKRISSEIRTIERLTKSIFLIDARLRKTREKILNEHGVVSVFLKGVYQKISAGKSQAGQ